MAVDAWPEGLNHGVIAFAPVGGGRGSEAFGGLPGAVGASTGGPHWTARLTNMPLRERDIAAARGLQSRLMGGAMPILLPACDGGLAPSVVATIAADTASGATQVLIAAAGEALVGGEHFSIDHAADQVLRRMYRLTEDLGEGVWRITPGLRDAVVAGQALDFETPSCPMRLAGGFDLPVRLGRFSETQGDFVEWFDRSPANAPIVIPPDPPPETAFRYHRLRAVHTFDGDSTWTVGDYGFLDDWAGASIPGAAISSAVLGGVLANARDGNPLTYVTVSGSGGWVGIDAGAPIAALEAFVRVSSSSFVAGSASELAYDVGVDDGAGGITWTPYKSWTQTRWWERTIRYFDIGDAAESGWVGAGVWRVHRLTALTVNSGAHFAAAFLNFRATALDTTNVTATLGPGDLTAGQAFNLLDAGPTAYLSYCQVLAGDGGFFEADSGKTPIAQCEQAVLMSLATHPFQMPGDMVIGGSLWAGVFEPLYTSNEAPWGPAETRTFTLPAP